MREIRAIEVNVCLVSQIVEHIRFKLIPYIVERIAGVVENSIALRSFNRS